MQDLSGFLRRHSVTVDTVVFKPGQCGDLVDGLGALVNLSSRPAAAAVFCLNIDHCTGLVQHTITGQMFVQAQQFTQPTGWLVALDTAQVAVVSVGCVAGLVASRSC